MCVCVCVCVSKKKMLDTRSNDWQCQSIPAQSWKYTPRPYDVEKDYAKYPDRVVTHPKCEPFVQCHNCLTLFSTDARRKNNKGEWIYAPVTNFITYRAGLNASYCLTPCKDPRDNK